MRLLWLLLIPLVSFAHNFEGLKIHQISFSPRIFYIENFLPDETCDQLRRLSRPHLERSFVVPSTGGAKMLHPGRTSMSAFLVGPARTPFVTDLEERMAEVVGMPTDHGEAIQVARYRRGDEYQPHYDTFNPEEEGGQIALKNGGQRLITFMVYLTDVRKGGETGFPFAGIKIPPKKGDALLFYPCLDDHSIDMMALHAGCPVIEGEKWIATRWFRERPFH